MLNVCSSPNTTYCPKSVQMFNHVAVHRMETRKYRGSTKPLIHEDSWSTVLWLFSNNAGSALVNLDHWPWRQKILNNTRTQNDADVTARVKITRLLRGKKSGIRTEPPVNCSFPHLHKGGWTSVLANNRHPPHRQSCPLLIEDGGNTGSKTQLLWISTLLGAQSSWTDPFQLHFLPFHVSLLQTLAKLEAKHVQNKRVAEEKGKLLQRRWNNECTKASKLYVWWRGKAGQREQVK